MSQQNAGVPHRPDQPIGSGERGDLRRGQFRSKKFVRALGAAGLLESMGRVGACPDNAAMESLFALLQKNVLNLKRWATWEELLLAINTWNEATYHRNDASALWES